MSETKTAFAERAIQSLKQKIYCYIKDIGENIVHTLPQFLSTRIFCFNKATGNSPRDVKNTDFLSTLNKKPSNKKQENKIQIWRQNEFFEERYSFLKEMQTTIYKSNFRNFGNINKNFLNT